MITKMGIKVTAPGIISVAIRMAKMTLRPGKRWRAKAKAASEQENSCPSALKLETSRLLTLALTKGNLDRASEKLDHTMGCGIHCGGNRKTSPSGLIAVEIIHRNGTTMTTAPRPRSRWASALPTTRP